MIFAIAGQKRSGKDTIANFITKDSVGMPFFVRYGFADPIRRFAKDAFIWDDNWIDNHKEEIDPYWGISYRQFAQYVGTQFAQFDLPKAFPLFEQVVGRLMWVKRFLKFYELTPGNYVISDVRFPHEVSMLKSGGATVIRVEREGFQNNDPHESEIFISSLEVDKTFYNNSSIENLENQIESYLLSLLKDI